MSCRLFSAGVVYMLLCLIQRAVLQDANVEVCPSLSGESVRVLCQSTSGQIACTDAQVGIKARAFWRKTIVTGIQPVGDTTLVCQSPGVWVMEKSLDKTNNSRGQQGGGNGGVAVTVQQAVTTTTTMAAKASTTVPTNTKSAGTSYVTIAGFGLYKYIKFTGSLVEANETCRNEGSRLFVVDSMAEMNAVFFKLLQPNLKDFTSAGLFLGVRMNKNKRFYTEFGAPFPGNSGLRWGKNEPSLAPNEECIFIDVPGFMAHDMACKGYVANVVCERPLK